MAAINVNILVIYGSPCINVIVGEPPIKMSDNG